MTSTTRTRVRYVKLAVRPMSRRGRRPAGSGRDAQQISSCRGSGRPRNSLKPRSSFDGPERSASSRQVPAWQARCVHPTHRGPPTRDRPPAVARDRLERSSGRGPGRWLAVWRDERTPRAFASWPERHVRDRARSDRRARRECASYRHLYTFAPVLGQSGHGAGGLGRACGR